jgi:hypothetical protein
MLNGLEKAEKSVMTRDNILSRLKDVDVRGTLYDRLGKGVPQGEQ